MAASLTQAELAASADLSLKYVGEIERGDANTTVEVLERLSNALKWDLMDAFAGLREPISEGVRVFLIDKFRRFERESQEAVQWLEALDPKRSKTVAPSSESDIVAPAMGGAIHRSRRKPRAKRLSQQNG